MSRPSIQLGFDEEGRLVLTVPRSAILGIENVSADVAAAREGEAAGEYLLIRLDFTRDALQNLVFSHLTENPPCEC